MAVSLDGTRWDAERRERNGRLVPLLVALANAMAGRGTAAEFSPTRRPRRDGGWTAEWRATFHPLGDGVAYEHPASLTTAQRLAVAVLMGDDAGPALADLLMELGVEPDGVGVERRRVEGLIGAGVARHLAERTRTTVSHINHIHSGAEAALTALLQAVRAGAEAGGGADPD